MFSLMGYMWHFADHERIKNTIESFYERWYATWALAISEGRGEPTHSDTTFNT